MILSKKSLLLLLCIALAQRADNSVSCTMPLDTEIPVTETQEPLAEKRQKSIDELVDDQESLSWQKAWQLMCGSDAQKQANNELPCAIAPQSNSDALDEQLAQQEILRQEQWKKEQQYAMPP